MYSGIYFKFCKTKHFLILIFLAGIVQLNAQNAKNRKGFSIESTIHLGRIVKHTPKLTFEVPRLSPGLDLNFKFQSWGKHPWEELRDYPLFGLGISYFHFGDKGLLGSSVSFIPNMTLFIANKKRWDAHFVIGSGLACLTQKFDNVKNPDYNAIGSHVNNTVSFKIGFGYKFTEHWRLVSGMAFTHFSNGSASLPNFGINIPALYLGASFTPVPLSEADYIRHNTSKKSSKRFGLSMHFGLAFTESEIPGGPKYPFYISSLAGNFYLNKVNRLHIGFAYEYDKAVHDFGEHVFEFNNSSEARKRSGRISVFVADEFLFGQWGIVLKSGYYISKNAYLLPLEYYVKLSTRYYLPAIGNPKTNFYVTLILKSHLFNAEYIGLGMGASL